MSTSPRVRRLLRIALLSVGTLVFSIVFGSPAMAHMQSNWYDVHDRYGYESTMRYGYRQPSHGGGVRIRASAGSAWIMRGGTITYNLFIHNDDARAHIVQVRASLDPLTSAIGASDSARVQGDVVYWDNVRIAAGSSKTFSIQARVHPGAPLNRNVLLTAYLPGSSDIVETELRQIRYGDSLPYYYSYDARNRTAYPSPAFGRNVYFHPPMRTSQYRNMFFGHVPSGPQLPCDSRFMRCY